MFNTYVKKYILHRSVFRLIITHLETDKIFLFVCFLDCSTLPNIKRKNQKMSLPMITNFFFLSPCPLLRPRHNHKSLLSIFHAGVLGLQAQGSLHGKLKYLYAPNLVGAHPQRGRAHGHGCRRQPQPDWAEKRLLPPAQTGWGYRLRPRVGQRGRLSASCITVFIL